MRGRKEGWRGGDRCYHNRRGNSEGGRRESIRGRKRLCDEGEGKGGRNPVIAGRRDGMDW